MVQAVPKLGGAHPTFLERFFAYYRHREGLWRALWRPSSRDHISLIRSERQIRGAPLSPIFMLKSLGGMEQEWNGEKSRFDYKLCPEPITKSETISAYLQRKSRAGYSAAEPNCISLSRIHRVLHHGDQIL